LIERDRKSCRLQARNGGLDIAAPIYAKGVTARLPIRPSAPSEQFAV